MIYITDKSEIFGSNNKNTNHNLMYFYSDWMLYHKKMVSLIQKIEDLNYPLNIFAIDIDSFPDLVKKYEIKSIPTVLILSHNFLEMNRIIGFPLTQPFKKVISDIFKLYESRKKRKERGTNNDKK